MFLKKYAFSKKLCYFHSVDKVLGGKIVLISSSLKTII